MLLLQLLSLAFESLSAKYFFMISSYSSTPVLAFSTLYLFSKHIALGGNLGFNPGSSSGYPMHSPQIGIQYLGKFNSLVIYKDLYLIAPISTVPKHIDSAATVAFCILIPTSCDPMIRVSIFDIYFSKSSLVLPAFSKAMLTR